MEIRPWLFYCNFVDCYLQAVTSYELSWNNQGPDCNKPQAKLPRSNYMLPLQAKTNTQTPTLNNLPKFIFPHAHWVRAIQRWNGRGRKCLFNALATQLCALRLYSQLMSDWVVMVTTQYSNTCEWPLNIQRRYLWKKNTIKFDLLSSDTTPPSSWIFSLYITCRTCSCCQIRLSSFFWSAVVIVYLVNDAVIHSFTGAKVFRTSDVPSNLFNRFTNVSCQQLNLNAN